MATWIESAVTYTKIGNDGKVKKTTERHLFDALSFTEAEARTIEKLTPYISGEFTVKAVKKTNISEIFVNETGDRYWLAQVAFTTIDEKSGVEKETISQILVQASTFDEAVANLKEGMAGTMADWRIKSLAETAYIEVYPAKLSEVPESDNQ